MVNIDYFNELDKKISYYSKSITPLDYIEPINESKQKKKFFENNERENPNFIYKSYVHDINDKLRGLESLKIPTGIVGLMYKGRIEDKILDSLIIKYVGNKDLIKKYSIEKYGEPTDKLVNYAREILKTFPEKKEERIYSSVKLKEEFQKLLDFYKLKRWKIRLYDGNITRVCIVRKKILISKNRFFSQNDISRLAVHEILVHVFRCENGVNQKFKIFGKGLRGYLETEEGLATYAEFKTGFSNTNVLRIYAGRVLSIKSMIEGDSFVETYHKLRKFFDKNKSWDLTIRSHRGGGFVKDHLYLNGFLKVKEYAESNNDIKPLYVGKISLDNLFLISKLQNTGLINEVKYLPDFFKQ